MERDEINRGEFFIVYISTHTLTWSVTTGFYQFLVIVEYFNSHAHVERDITMKNEYYSLKISTHTLTWSVTN